eukprot:2981924-Rhodomonas_salina.1
MTFPALISWVMPSCRHRSAPSSLEAVHSRACPISHPLPVSHPPALKSRPPSMKCTDPRTASSFNLPSPSSPPNSFLIHVFGLTCSTVPLEQVLRFSKPLAKIEGETTINRGGVRGEVECTGNQLQQAPAVSPRLLPSSRMHFQPFVFAWVWCNACSCSCSCPALVGGEAFLCEDALFLFPEDVTEEEEKAEEEAKNDVRPQQFRVKEGGKEVEVACHACIALLRSRYPRLKR